MLVYKFKIKARLICGELELLWLCCIKLYSKARPLRMSTTLSNPSFSKLPIHIVQTQRESITMPIDEHQVYLVYKHIHEVFEHIRHRTDSNSKEKPEVGGHPLRQMIRCPFAIRHSFLLRITPQAYPTRIGLVQFNYNVSTRSVPTEKSTQQTPRDLAINC